MWRIPIMAKERNPSGNNRGGSRKFQTLCRPLPTFHMSDYSVLGFLFDRPEDAVRVLGENRYHLAEDECGVEVIVDHPQRAHDMVRLLAARGIDSEIGDVVHEVYQR